MANSDLVTGSCLCGSVSWQAQTLFAPMSHCHCSMCRKSHGAPFATYVGAEAAGFRWRSGEEHIVRYRSSDTVDRGFCARCGSVVPDTFAGGKAWSIPVGCLDQDPGVRPSSHTFVASKALWYVLPNDGLERYDAYPPESGIGSIERAGEQAAEPGWVAGSCLCSDVVYEMQTGDWTLMQCHCSRCRKGRAAAHGGNLFVESARLRWRRGEDRLRTYKVPEAQRHAQTFCVRCGSCLPRAAGPRFVVPAASLDGDPGIGARRHIFVGSKAPWFTINDDWPQDEAFPPAS
jgi:hypothetical protein